jgi:hypothetical protein
MSVTLNNIHGNSKKMSLSFEFSHEFELNTQTQNSPKMSYSTQWLDSKLIKDESTEI